MFFKVGVLKNCAILEPVSDKVAGLLLWNTYGRCFWIFEQEIPFFSLIWYLLLTVPTVFVLDFFENTS